MKTALKLNKKELFSLYEKSNDRIKEALRLEFGQDYFVTEKVKPEIHLSSSSNSGIQKKNNKTKLLDWEAILDYTTVFRMLGYASLIFLIFQKI